MSLHNELIAARFLRWMQIGATAMTSDGKKLGTVERVEGRSIRISVPFGRDYWLNADYVTEQGDNRVTFGFTKDQLGAYRMDKPATATDPLTDAPDAVLSQEEQIQQRARMERELSQQRRAS